ncbi:MAG: MFS transporter small subunit [Thiohalocapsa sp.]
MATKNAEGNALKLILAWGFVGIPLAWGVIETCINALKLFH